VTALSPRQLVLEPPDASTAAAGCPNKRAAPRRLGKADPARHDVAFRNLTAALLEGTMVFAQHGSPEEAGAYRTLVLDLIDAVKTPPKEKRLTAGKAKAVAQGRANAWILRLPDGPDRPSWTWCRAEGLRLRIAPRDMIDLAYHARWPVPPCD
jgi:hypothetical protein